MKPAKPNMWYLGQGFYLVSTQAGFRKALKHFNADFFDGPYDQSRGGDTARRPSDVQGYPRTYPSLVHLTDEHVGSCYSFTAATCTPISKLRAAFTRFLWGKKT